MIGPGAVNYTLIGTSRGIPQPSGVAQDYQDPEPAQSPAADVRRQPRIFVAGSLAVDLSCDHKPFHGDMNAEPALKTSNPAQIQQSLGGVGSNVARATHLLGGPVRLCSAVGNDLAGSAALTALSSHDMDTTAIRRRHSHATAQYVAMNDVKRDLFIAMADMSILDDVGAHLTEAQHAHDSIMDIFETAWRPQVQDSQPTHLVLDANWPASMLQQWRQVAREVSAFVSFEPVSTAKAARLFAYSPGEDASLSGNILVDLASPNGIELTAMYNAAKEYGWFDSPYWWTVIDALGIPSTGARTQLALATSSDLVDRGIPQQSIQLLPYIPSILTKLGADGVLLTQLLRADDPRLSDGSYAPYILSRCSNWTEDSLGVGGVYMRLFPAKEKVAEEDIVSVNGVGDTFLGAVVAGWERRGPSARVEDCIDLAQQAAILTLKSKESVSPELKTLAGSLV